MKSQYVTSKKEMQRIIVFMENTTGLLTVESIRNCVYTIRGQQVMLDSDLAMLYQVETKVFNQAVSRNIERFPENFRFQLTKEEFDSLRSQIVTSNNLVLFLHSCSRLSP